MVEKSLCHLLASHGNERERSRWMSTRSGSGCRSERAGGEGDAARLFIHERRGRLVECLPTLQHDPNRPEDVLKVDADEDGVGGDGAADCLSYLMATKARAVSQRQLRRL